MLINLKSETYQVKHISIIMSALNFHFQDGSLPTIGSKHNPILVDHTDLELKLNLKLLQALNLLNVTISFNRELHSEKIQLQSALNANKELVQLLEHQLAGYDTELLTLKKRFDALDFHMEELKRQMEAIQSEINENTHECNVKY